MFDHEGGVMSHQKIARDDKLTALGAAICGIDGDP